ARQWRLCRGAHQRAIPAHLQPPLVQDERRAFGRLLVSTEASPTAGHELLRATATYEPSDLSVSHLATKLVDLTDAKALAVLVEMRPRVFCVVRSRIPELDAAMLAAALGGGGHAQAASASLRSELADARGMLHGALESAVREPPRARDVMSKPARSVSPDETVAQAMVS